MIMLTSKLSYRDAANQFNILHPNMPPISFTTVCRIFNLFKSSGSVDAAKQNRTGTLNEDKQTDILARFVTEQTCPLRQVARKVNVSKNTFHRLLNNNRFRSFKLKTVHKLHDNDMEKRVIFL